MGYNQGVCHIKIISPLQQNGFTLVELIIVIAIISTLAGIAVPFYSGYVQKAHKLRIISELKMIEKEITAYKIEWGVYPDSLRDIGLENLKDPWGNPYQYLKIEGVEKGKPPEKGKPENKEKSEEDQTLKQPRKDHFLVPVNTDFDLYSMGPDGKTVAPFTAKASRDDVVRANNGQYIGLASEY